VFLVLCRSLSNSFSLFVVLSPTLSHSLSFSPSLTSLSNSVLLSLCPPSTVLP
jgi:hypothetical protein